MSAPFTTTGTLTDGTTLTLDSPVPVGSGRVKVVVEPIPSEDVLDLDTFLEEMREGEIARGFVPRTREEIDAQMREERAGWDHRP